MVSRPDGKLAQNILLFARTLRSAGMAVGTGQVIDALQSVALTGIGSRQDFYWALRALLVKRKSDVQLFDQAFHIYFRNPRLLERMMALLLPSIEAPEQPRQSAPGARRLIEALGDNDDGPPMEGQIVVDASLSSSTIEVLGKKDFEQMSLEEQALARRLMSSRLEALEKRRVRRFRASPRGHRIDLRKTIRQMQRQGGDYIPLEHKERVKRPPDLVLICDISGSMSGYSRMFLHFAFIMSRRLPVVHSFVFGTRLTNISRRLAGTDADQALADVAIDASDWDGGTRIADCLGAFNREWNRRVLSRGATVLLLTDGLERDPDSDLEAQMRRLHQSSRTLIWMNPMLRFDRFEPRASGIRRMLPHVDCFVPGHNIDSLTGIWQNLLEGVDRQRASMRQLPGAA